MPKVRNISKEQQSFTGHATFEPDESRTVSDEQAEIFSRSPFMAVEEEVKQPKAKTFKATE